MFYYLTDQLGTSRVIAEVPSGQTTATMCYDGDFEPYGGEHAYINTCPQNYKFTGKERDSESDLDNFGARYYASTTGRFMSPDWALKPVTVPYASFGDPQTLNLYTYVENSPLNRIDADGHMNTSLSPDSQSNDTEHSPGNCQLQAWGGVGACNPQPGVEPPLDLTDPNGKQSEPTAPAQNTVTVEQVTGQGANVADHAAISVDGKQAVGLEQKKDSASAALEDKTTPGAVRPVDPNREVKDKAIISVTKDQADKIQTFLDKAVKSPPDYNLYHSNCAQFCESALRAGGLTNVPNDVTPKGLVQDLKGTPITDYFFVAP